MEPKQLLKVSIDELSKLDRAQLKYAFDNMLPAIFPLSNGRFIGVHCLDDLTINIEWHNEYWFVGTMKEKK